MHLQIQEDSLSMQHWRTLITELKFKGINYLIVSYFLCQTYLDDIFT